VTTYLDQPGFELWPLLERASDGIVLITADAGRIVLANAQAAKILCRAPAELIGCSIDEFIDPASRAAFDKLTRIPLHQEAIRDPVLITLRSAEGCSRQVCLAVEPLNVDSPRLLGISLYHVGEGHGDTARIDPLTFVADRQVLQEALLRLLPPRSPERAFALLFVDLNDYKQVNDEYGHLIGDRVLMEVARRFKQCVSDRALLVRYGGDEFVLLIENASNHDDINKLVEVIRNSLEIPVETPKGAVQLSASIGVAFGPADYRTPEDVIDAADRAMYAAKRAM